MKSWQHLFLNLITFYLGLRSNDYGTNGAETPEHEHLTRLYQDLHEGYNHRVKPAIHPGVPIEFHIQIFPLTIIEVNEIEKYLEMNLWMSLEWIDPRLRWDPHEYGEDSEIKIPPNDIWVPDMVLVNANNVCVENMSRVSDKIHSSKNFVSSSRFKTFRQRPNLIFST